MVLSVQFAGLTAAFLLSTTFETLFGGYLDGFFVLGFVVWREKALLIDLAESHIDDDISSVVLNALLACAIAFIWFRLRLLLVSDVGADQGPWNGIGKPMLFPARTTHRRVFPKKHAFSYSYLVVGVPVGWEGSSNGMISTNKHGEEQDSFWFPTKASPARAWFHVDGADHLERGPGTLKTKLDNYLRSQNIDPVTFPHAYLITAASFMGYNFNPVSFWYLYSEAKELAAMILEVNNTFGERRMYFLAANDERAYAAAGQDQPSKFTSVWPKDFHVSPFNSRKGSYSLSVHDILAKVEGDHMGILDGTITLRSSKEHPKIVARLFGEGKPVDPATLSMFDKARFILQWWWVGFVTFPRIVREAAKLFFQRKLHVWFRPEPLESTMSRVADMSETQLEPIFRAYLRHLVKQSGAKLTVKYTPAGGVGEEEIMRTLEATNIPKEAGSQRQTEPSALDATKEAETLDFRVLTPAFYTRFVHYAHDFEAVFAELRENQTIHVSRPELLPEIFVSKLPPAPLMVENARDGFCFRAIKALRRLPERIERPLTSSASPAASKPATHTVTDVRGFRLSGMDGFVLTQADEATRCRYEEIVLKTFLAERLALGSTGLLWLQEVLVRGGFAWVISLGLSALTAGLIEII